VLPVYQGWKGTSWLLGSAVTGDALRKLCVVLWAVAGLGLLAAGIALAFASSSQSAWRPLAIGASAVGILSFLAFWDGQGRRLFEEGAVGAVLSLALLVAALVLPRAFGPGG